LFVNSGYGQILIKEKSGQITDQCFCKQQRKFEGYIGNMILMRAEAVIKGCRMYTGYIIITAEIKETIGHSEFSQARLPFRYKLISTLTPNQASMRARDLIKSN